MDTETFLPPSNLAITVNEGGMLSLTWNDNSTGEIGFQLQKKDGYDGEFSWFSTLSPDTESHQLNFPFVTFPMCFRLAALDALIQLSGFSNVVCVLPNEPPIDVACEAPAPSLPTDGRVAAGNNHSLVLTTSGGIVSWGHNNGALGDGGSESRNYPAPIPSLNAVLQIEAGSSHSLAIRSDGSVWTWGNNFTGELGDGTTTTRFAPIQVVGLPVMVDVDGGSGFSLAVSAAGEVFAWGFNSNGQLGDGSNETRTTPVRLNLADIVAVSAGHTNSLALRRDGKVYAWGAFTGDGTSTARNQPSLVNGLENITAISAGENYALVLDDTGQVWAWGNNSFGALGDGSTQDRLSPFPVVGLNDVIAVAAGVSRSVALHATGDVSHWGRGIRYLDEDVRSPLHVVGLANVNSIASGFDHSVAIRADGLVCSWGLDRSQLGHGQGENFPHSVVGLNQQGSLSLPDNQPNPFTFPDVVGAGLNQQVESDPIMVLGIVAEAPISISGGAYVVNGSASSNSLPLLSASESVTEQPTMVQPGDTVSIRMNSSSDFFSTTEAVLTIGGVSSTFSVQTIGAAPTVATNDATGILTSQAVLNGAVTANGLNTTVLFEYGVTDTYGQATFEQGIGASNASQSVQQLVANLTCDTEYHFRLTASNSHGLVTSENQTFRTDRCDADGDGLPDDDEPSGASIDVPDVLFALNTGANLISFPIFPAGANQSLDILSLLGADSISRLSNGIVETTYATPPHGVLFDIHPRVAYQVRVPDDGATVIEGQAVALSALSLSPGQNWVGFVTVPPSRDTAFKLLSDSQFGGELLSITSFNIENGRYETAVMYDGQPAGVDFRLTEAKATFLICPKQSNSIPQGENA